MSVFGFHSIHTHFSLRCNVLSHVRECPLHHGLPHSLRHDAAYLRRTLHQSGVSLCGVLAHGKLKTWINGQMERQRDGWIDKHSFVSLFFSLNSLFFLSHFSSHPSTLSHSTCSQITDSFFSFTHAHNRSMPWYIGWVKYLSWFMYSNEASTIIQWRGVKNISKCVHFTDIYILHTTPSIICQLGPLSNLVLLCPARPSKLNPLPCPVLPVLDPLRLALP